MNADCVPPESLEGHSDKEIDRFKTDFDVVRGLRRLGHEVFKLGVTDELAPLGKALENFEPHIAFNLLEEFRYQAVYDQNVVSYLELMRTPYTGCNPRGLVLARDKALSKKVLHYHRIRAPNFMVVPVGRRPKLTKRLAFPLIVKSQIEEASAGIAQASVVHGDQALQERTEFIHQNLQTAAIVEQYVDGRELYLGILGNRRLQVLPPWEIFFDKLPPDAPRIATEKVKWDLDYQEKYDIRIGPAKGLDDDVVAQIGRVGRRIYHLLSLSGYARLDFRLREDGQLFFLEANPNPDIASDEELASAARAAGLPYTRLLQKILNLGMRWSPGQ